RHTRFSRDWSSDVCSSDLVAYRLTGQSYLAEIATVTITLVGLALLAAWPGWSELFLPVAVAAKLAVCGLAFAVLLALFTPQRFEIGRASCRERVENSGWRV